MLKNAAMVTTALVVATSMAFAAGQGKQNLGPAHQTRVSKDLVQIGKDKRGFAPAVINTRPGKNPAKTANWQDINTAGRTFNNFSRSPNALFLSWYGWAAQGNVGSGIGYQCNSHSCYSVGISYNVQQGAALKLAGTGNEVKKIEVGSFEQNNYASCVSWSSCHAGRGSVALYSNATGSACTGTSGRGAPSCPGTAIANAGGTFSATAPSTLCCNVITVPIHKTTLAAGTQYWLYLKGDTSGGNNAIVWDSEDTDFAHNPLGSMVYSYSFHTNYTTGATNTYNSGWLSDNSNLFPGAAKL